MWGPCKEKKEGITELTNPLCVCVLEAPFISTASFPKKNIPLLIIIERKQEGSPKKKKQDLPNNQGPR